MEFITVFTTLNLAQADLVASELEAAGFTVGLPDEFVAQTLGASTFSGEISAGIRVQVPQAQAEEARALLAATIASPNPPPTDTDAASNS